MELKCNKSSSLPVTWAISLAVLRMVLPVLLLLASERVLAADTSKILQQCRDLSLLDDDIHNCLDNYLDVMDDNLADVSDLIRAELSAATSGASGLPAFEASQQAFENYRTSNCLWYLEFSEPRVEAEQIAKNCLASMSEQRLSELQLLVKIQTRPEVVSGYYVYGSERNTLQLCGGNKRYWVEGDNVVVSELQQRYLGEANTDLQIMFVELEGDVDTEAIETFPGHDGVFKLGALVTLRTPVDSDCVIPRGTDSQTPVADQQDEATTPDDTSVASQTSVETNPDEPIQSLTAYFGDWIARCEQLGSSYGCVLSINMTPAGSGSETVSDTEDIPKLIITRRSEARTVIDVDMPLGLVPSLDDIEKVHWQVDSVNFGPLLHSRLESLGPSGAQTHIRQALRERWFIRDELLPVMKSGRELSISLLPDTDSKLNLSATLQGLTRALEFADDFTAAEGEI